MSILQEELVVTDVAEVGLVSLFKKKKNLVHFLNVFMNIVFFKMCSTDKTTDAKMMKAGGTEIGKTLAEKSRGLFSANDWQCKTYVLVVHSASYCAPLCNPNVGSSLRS